MSVGEGPKDEKDREKLVERARAIVEAMLLSIAARGGWHILDDIRSAGLLGGWRAAMAYDFASETPFEGFAWMAIVGAMIDEVKRERKHARLPVEVVAFLDVAAAEAVLATAALADDGGADETGNPIHAVAAAIATGFMAARPAVSAEAEAIARQALARLPARDQQLIRWHVVDGLSFVSIADRLGIHERTVRERYADAMKRLGAAGRVVRENHR